jgi:SAM-dependent methyltransferase
MSKWLTQWVFQQINRGPEVEPRRLKFAKNLKLIRSKSSGVWLDLGAGDGTYLKFMNEKSFGLDIKQNLEKKIYSWNFNDKVPVEYRETADVIWCSALIEHVMRPHEFLVEIKKFLKRNGVLIIIGPLTHMFNPFYLSGTYHGDHVNFFNAKSFRLTIERAGYEVKYQVSPSFKKIGQKIYFISPNIMIVAKPILNFQYPESAHKYLDKDQNIQFKEGNFAH